MTRSLWFAFTVALLTMTGCVPIPIADPEPFREETIGTIGPGTTRADVVFALGAPYWSHDEDRVFVYARDEAKMAYVIVLGAETAGGVGGGVLSKRHLLVIEFDDDGRVYRLEGLDLGIGATVLDTGRVGHDDVVCTSWGLCLAQSGATIVPEDI